MKVVLASLSYLPAFGGLVSYLASFARHLVRADRQVTVLCANQPGAELSAREVIGGVEIRRVHALRQGPFEALLKPLFVVWRFRGAIARDVQAPDVVVVRHFYLAAAFALVPRLRSRVVYLAPLVAPRLIWIDRHDCGPLRRLYSLWLLPLFFLVEAFAVHRLPHVAALSTSKQDEIRSFYRLRKAIHVIPPGIDTERFRPPVDQDERTSLLQQLGRPEDAGRTIVLTVCRLVAEKNVGRLLEAMAALPDRETVLYVVGDGPLRPVLVQRAIELGIASRTVFFGQRDDPERFYRVADLFVLASTYEGFGHVYLEALASGTPVAGLAAKPPGVITATAEIVTDAIGAVVPEDSTVAFVDAMDHLLRSDSRQRRVRCREHAVAVYSWDAHLRRLLQVVEDSGDV